MTENNDEKRTLEYWSNRLTQALQILDLKEENDLILRLAQESSQSVSPSSGPISTFYAGYAAALAATSGHVDPQEAVKTAVGKVRKLCEEGSEAGKDSGGWAETGQ
ncbi:DUF6457 domain-containing protein [Paeniglutamicibacter antarcticus]|uniref:DUF6457 domain-containing protein n=1 Tax=Paeniglutamicibacter antarcticus TaxID=494023 RepID=A0ABP9TNW8_9MICC